MSWIRRRPLLSCFLLALFLRGGLAVLTEFKPLFPAYYYTDAELIDQAAWEAARAWKNHDTTLLAGSLSQRTHVFLLAHLYLLVGHCPLAAKFAMSLLGSAAVAAFFFLIEPAFGFSVSLGSCVLLSVWPSHIFFTSQNFKDALAILLCYAGLRGPMGAIAGEVPGRLAWIVVSSLALVFLGFLRIYLMLAAAAACALTLLWAGGAALRRRRPIGHLTAALAAVLAAAALSRPLYRAALAGPLKGAEGARYNPIMPWTLGPAAREPAQSYPRPLSPRWISRIRAKYQSSDQLYAQGQHHRRVATQLFPGLLFDGWRDLLTFLPKGMFYVLFMPLPGLYPLEGNAGRIAASFENLVLLAVALAALAGIPRGRKSPARMLLILFFLIMASGSSLIELDLGAATRHRTLYMPFLFPFALSLFERRRRPREGGRLKVFEVLECGGPGGTGNQVAAICNALDPERFEAGLAFASRGTDPEEYRQGAAGAKKAFYIPEMVREISVLQDLKALIKLYRLFRREAPDVVHAHSSKGGFLARLAAWLAGVPRIFYSPHGYGFLQQDRSRAARALYKTLEFSVSWIGEIAAVSPSEAELARRLSWGKPVHVVKDAYLGESPAPELSPHEGTAVGSCGRLAAARNPEAFINLAQRLTDSRNNLKCVWIGGGEAEPSLRTHLENMNLLGKVEVTGWLEAGKVQERLRGLDILVHFSRWDAMPNAVLEAMALGLPVVASDIPANRDAVIHGETGFLAKNEIELLEYCLKLVDDPDLRSRLGGAGRERVRREFGLREALSALEELYAN